MPPTEQLPQPLFRGCPRHASHLVAVLLAQQLVVLQLYVLGGRVGQAQAHLAGGQADRASD